MTWCKSMAEVMSPTPQQLLKARRGKSSCQTLWEPFLQFNARDKRGSERKVSEMGKEVSVPFELLTPKQVARILKCSEAWVYKASASRLLPSVCIPCAGIGTRKKNMVRFEIEAVRDFVKVHRKSVDA